MNTEKKDLLSSPFVNVTLFSLFWAIQVFISKLALNAGAKPVPFTMQSSAFALLLLLGYVLIFKREVLRRISFPLALKIWFASAMHSGVGSCLSYVGLSMTSAINSGFLMQFSTVTTSSLAYFMLKERMTASKIITIAIIMIGTFLLITKGHLDTPHLGDVLLLLACCGWSTGNVTIRKILKDNPIDSSVISLFRPLGGLPTLLAIMWLSDFFPASVKAPFQGHIFEINSLSYVIVNAVLIVLILTFLNRTLRIASASYMTMMSSITPVLIALLAILFLHESLAPIQWFGVALILLSSYATQLLKVANH